MFHAINLAPERILFVQNMHISYERWYAIAMKDNTGRIAMRTPAPIELRLKLLMKKKGLTRNEIVRTAISEMADREVADLLKNK